MNIQDHIGCGYNYNMNDDLEILGYLKDLKLKGIRYLYSSYGKGMIVVAFQAMGDLEKATDIVFDTFWKLWMEKKFSDVVPPLRPFLYNEIKKACKS
jgi:hypothetical protein